MHIWFIFLTTCFPCFSLFLFSCLKKKLFSLYSVVFQVLSLVNTVYLCCSINKHLFSFPFLSFLFFFSFFCNHFKVEKPSRRQICTHAHKKTHGTSFNNKKKWKESEKKEKKEKSENPISAPCSDACRALKRIGRPRKKERERERERKKSSQRLHTCIHRPKTHTYAHIHIFYFNFFLSISFLFIYSNFDRIDRVRELLSLHLSWF